MDSPHGPQPIWQTPPELARQLAVDVLKVHRWIKRGELAAVNVASDLRGRPRYRISAAAVDAFLAGRAVVAPPAHKPRRRKRDNAHVIQFFNAG